MRYWTLLILLFFISANTVNASDGYQLPEGSGYNWVKVSTYYKYKFDQGRYSESDEIEATVYFDFSNARFVDSAVYFYDLKSYTDTRTLTENRNNNTYDYDYKSLVRLLKLHCNTIRLEVIEIQYRPEIYGAGFRVTKKDRDFPPGVNYFPGSGYGTIFNDVCVKALEGKMDDVRAEWRENVDVDVEDYLLFYQVKDELTQ